MLNRNEDRLNGLPRGIVAVVQTPFGSDYRVDFASLDRLIEDTIEAGVDGLLAPVVASEVASLAFDERKMLVERMSAVAAGRVPIIVGASEATVEACVAAARQAEQVGAVAYLVAVPEGLYQRPEEIVPFFRAIASDCPTPLIIQDLQFDGPGLELGLLGELAASLGSLAGMKIETVPSGPKYTAVREALGAEFYIAGGWAVSQMIEAFDRGVDAMIPESSMVRVYSAIRAAYANGNREKAVAIFRRLLPVLTFSNQELAVSIAFFKRLLVRKGIFTDATMRICNFTWDRYHLRIADELIEYYLELEAELAG